VDFRVIVVSGNDCLDPSEAVIDEIHALHVEIAASLTQDSTIYLLVERKNVLC
jgi:hypothetical protein